MRDSAIVWQQVDTAVQQFLIVELDLGMTFVRAAADADNTQERLHNRRLARKVYDNGLRWVVRARFNQEETKTYYEKLRLLRLALNKLGDPIQDSYCDDFASL
jgi:hypothetical protein